MRRPLAPPEIEKLRKQKQAINIVVWANTLSSAFVAVFLLYVFHTLPLLGGRVIILSLVPALIAAIALFSHWLLARRRTRVGADLAAGLAEEIVGDLEKFPCPGGWVVKINRQRFVADRRLGRDIQPGTRVNLAYGPQSKVVLSVTPL